MFKHMAKSRKLAALYTILYSGLYMWYINIQQNDTQHIGDTFILCNSFNYSAECHCAECGSANVF